MDYSTPTQKDASLVDAVEVFTDVSEKLLHSYQELEKRFSILSNRLEDESHDRLQQLTEKEHLADCLQNLIEILPGGLIILDASGIVVKCNPVALELLGNPLLNEQWSDIVKRVFSPRSDDGFEVSLHDGRRISIATRALQGKKGQLLLLNDLTETRALQEHLSQKKRLAEMGEMSAHLAHQIRTPLATALLYLSHLRMPRLSSQKRIYFSEKSLTCLYRLEQQVKDMLVFVKGGSTVFSPCSITEIIEEVKQSSSLQLELASAKLSIKNELEDVVINCNKEALVGALQNLINNSIQACTKKAKIRLIAKPTKQGLIDLIIADNGLGMPTKVSQKISKAFFTTREKGTGLGLAVVQAVAKSHCGDIWITSKVGIGTKVGIRLPIR